MLEKDLELFEDYLSNTLSENEKEAFEIRLSSELIFKENFLAYKNTNEMLSQKFDDTDRIAFKNILAQQSDVFFKPKEATKKSFSFYKYAAVVVLLISAISFYIMNSERPSYADYSDFESISLTQRSSANELVKKAEDAFNSKSFENASTYLKELIAQEPDNQELKLYLGIALIEINNFSGAFENLTSVASGNSVYKYEAHWYIALSYLKQNQYDKVKAELQKIPENAAEYSKTQELLKKL